MFAFFKKIDKNNKIDWNKETTIIRYKEAEDKTIDELKNELDILLDDWSLERINKNKEKNQKIFFDGFNIALKTFLEKCAINLDTMVMTADKQFKNIFTRDLLNTKEVTDFLNEYGVKFIDVYYDDINYKPFSVIIRLDISRLKIKGNING